jgi:hypothetical protein
MKGMELKRAVLIGLTLMTLFLSGGCTEKAPKRDFIPVLKEQLFKLQQAVKNKDRVAIDSLLSVKILDNKQNSDSLLKLVYNYKGSYFPFERFGNYTIMYTNDRARIDCYVMDSTASDERPIVLTYVYEHDMWLLKRFEAVDKSADSL